MTVPVGADGVVDVFSSAGGNVIVDLLGYYTAADAATAGRFQPLAAPTRVLDTRNVSTFRAGESRNFTVPGAAGASAVAVNLTAVTGAPGYWQVYPQGGAQPATSNLNSPAGFPAVAANQAIVTVDPSGGITIFSEAGGDLIIDVVGTYTGSAAPADTAGLFVPMTSPTRIVDTRVAALNPLGGTTRALPDWTLRGARGHASRRSVGPTWPPSCSTPRASTRSCRDSSPWAPPGPWPPVPSRPRPR